MGKGRTGHQRVVLKWQVNFENIPIFSQRSQERVCVPAHSAHAKQHPKSKRFWIARQPSEKSRKNLTNKLKTALVPNLSRRDAHLTAKQIWVGWCEYFRYSNANRVFYGQVRTVKRQLGRYLKRKYRRQRRPAPWRVLYKWLKPLTQGIRPIRVINDLVRQKTKANLTFDL